MLFIQHTSVYLPSTYWLQKSYPCYISLQLYGWYLFCYKYIIHPFYLSKICIVFSIDLFILQLELNIIIKSVILDKRNYRWSGSIETKVYIKCGDINVTTYQNKRIKPALKFLFPYQFVIPCLSQRWPHRLVR